MEKKTKQPDFQKILHALPGAYLVLLPDDKFTIIDGSNSYFEATISKRENVINKPLYLFLK